MTEGPSSRSRPFGDFNTSGATSSKKKSKSFRYKLHPDADFDPLEYLLSKEIKEATSGRNSFYREIKRLRFGLYRVYVETIRKSSKFSSILEDRFRFAQFLENNVVDIQISYSHWMYMFHIYLIYDAMSKISLSNRTFVDLLSLIQFTFYSLLFLSKIMGFRATEKSIYLNWTYLVGGALAIAVWCLPGNSVVEYPDRYQNLIWKAVVQWMFFLFGNRYFLSLINWEYENLIRQEDEKDVHEAKLFGNVIFVSNLRIICHKLWVYSLSCIPLLIWEVMCKISDRVSIWPGFFWIIFISTVSTNSFRIFLNFFSFQYQCLVWVAKWKKGLVIRRFGKHDSFGIIH